MNAKCIHAAGTIDGRVSRCRLNNVNQKGAEIRTAYMETYDKSIFFCSSACLFSLRGELDKCPYFQKVK